MIGPTGVGKTTLALELLPMRRWVVAFATKARDPVLDQLRRTGYHKVTSWVMADADVTPRVVLAPPLPHGARSLDEQREAFRYSLESVFRQQGWAVYLDEARYLTDYLDLGREVELLWQQGRSLGVSVIAGVQRPRHVPLLAYDQATHLFIWHDADESNLARLADFAGRADTARVREAVSALHSHEVLYLNTRTGDTCRTKVEV